MFLWGGRVYYPACSLGGRSNTSISVTIQSTGPSTLYSAVKAYCLSLLPKGVEAVAQQQASYIIRWFKFSEDPGHRNPNLPTMIYKELFKSTNTCFTYIKILDLYSY